MRLVGITHQGGSWIAVEQGSGLALIAPVDTFFQDPDHWLTLVSQGLPLLPVDPSADLVAPIPAVAKVFCAGLNYKAHAAESNMTLPKHPDIFGRWASTLVPSGAPVPVPVGEPGLDWEGELAVIVGRKLYNASPADVEASVFGYTCFNDLSARTHQLNAGQWTIGKNADRSGPIGPVIVTSDEIADPYSLTIQTRVDGVAVQHAKVSQMIFTIGELGAYISQCVTLNPGDVIATGTPEGIGATRKPPVYLQAGQIVEVEIEMIGVVRTPIVAVTDPVVARGEFVSEFA